MPHSSVMSLAPMGSIRISFSVREPQHPSMKPFVYKANNSRSQEIFVRSFSSSAPVLAPKRISYATPAARFRESVSTAVSDWNYIQRLSSGVSAVLCDLLLQKCSHTYDILHQPFGIPEHLMIHPLKNVSYLFPGCRTTGQKKGVIDMSVSMGFNVFQLPFNLKSPRDLQ